MYDSAQSYYDSTLYYYNIIWSYYDIVRTYYDIVWSYSDIIQSYYDIVQSYFEIHDCTMILYHRTMIVGQLTTIFGKLIILHAAKCNETKNVYLLTPFFTHLRWSFTFNLYLSPPRPNSAWCWHTWSLSSPWTATCLVLWPSSSSATWSSSCICSVTSTERPTRKMRMPRRKS